MRRFIVLGVALLCTTLTAASLHAGDLIWASDITDPAGADAGFVDLLTTAGHTVTRVDTPATLGDADIEQLNAADLVIVGRANSSSQFQGDNGAIWNAQVTAPVIAMSGYIVRDSRMRWVTASDLTDSGETQLEATIPDHPVFAGVSLTDGKTTDPYNVMVDRGISTNTNEPVNGSIIAVNPAVGAGLAVAEWPAGAVVGGDQVLAGYRMLFNAGSREPDGTGVDVAGMLDLTATGQLMFLNAVDHALAVPEPSSALLVTLGGMLLLALRRRQ